MQDRRQSFSADSCPEGEVLDSVDIAEDLHTLLTFKTQPCQHGKHLTPCDEINDQLEQEKKLCRFYHGPGDRRRPILSEAAYQRAQNLGKPQETDPPGGAQGLVHHFIKD